MSQTLGVVREVRVVVGVRVVRVVVGVVRVVVRGGQSGQSRCLPKFCLRLQAMMDPTLLRSQAVDWIPRSAISNSHTNFLGLGVPRMLASPPCPCSQSGWDGW